MLRCFLLDLSYFRLLWSNSISLNPELSYDPELSDNTVPEGSSMIDRRGKTMPLKSEHRHFKIKGLTRYYRLQVDESK